MSTTSMNAAPLGESLVLTHADASPERCRRLAALGLRRGAHLVLLHSTAGGGRVVDVAGSRIALDRSMLRQLFVEPGQPADPTQGARR